MSEIRIENDIREQLTEIFADKKVYIITDDNVHKLLDAKLKQKFKINILPPGEKSKTMRTAELILSDLHKHGYDRSACIVSIGGGVVGDMAGFVSGIYMRGVKWINVPTTLLSQVDSSIGGKTGVNLDGCKNIVGLFKQADETIISLHFLATLSEEDWLSGMGEMLKTSFLDKKFFDFLQPNFEKIKRRDVLSLREAVEHCIRIKKRITDMDFLEKGPRKALNIGHTLGHAMEAAENYKKSHGEYVLWGMKYENTINKEYIEPNFYLVMQTMISRALLGRTEPQAGTDEVIDLAMRDKKNTDDMISLMIPEKFGVVKEIKYKQKQLKKEFKKCR